MNMQIKIWLKSKHCTFSFNEPGSHLDSRTRVEVLAESTREANARYFASPDEVPSRCLTQGRSTILEARYLVLVAIGQEKAPAVAAMVEGPVTPCAGLGLAAGIPGAAVVRTRQPPRDWGRRRAERPPDAVEPVVRSGYPCRTRALAWSSTRQARMKCPSARCVSMTQRRVLASCPRRTAATYVRANVLPEDVTSLKPGQKVEFGIIEGRKGEQALSVRAHRRAPVPVEGAAEEARADGDHHRGPHQACSTVWAMATVTVVTPRRRAPSRSP